MKRTLIAVLLLSLCGGMWLRAAEEKIEANDSVVSVKDSANHDSIIEKGKEVFLSAMEMCMYYFCQYENFMLTAYNDGKGNPTIGLGNTQHPNGRKVRYGDRITKDQAIYYFEDYQLKKSWPVIEKCLRVDKMTASDFVAVTCLQWNCGPGVLTQNSGELANALNDFFENRESVAARNAVKALFDKRVYAKNRKTGRLEYMKGLDRRRNLELMVLFGEVKIGMESNTNNDPNYISLADVKMCCFNSVPFNVATSWDSTLGMHTAAADTTAHINNYDRGITFGEHLANCERQPVRKPQPRKPQPQKRTVRR